MWIEIKGKQHRVYWRTGLPVPAPARSYEAFTDRTDAEKFVELIRLVGLDVAQAVLQNPSAPAQAELVGRRTTAPRPDYIPPLAPCAGNAFAQHPPMAAGSQLTTVQALPTGVTFEVLWERFMERQRHLEEGTLELYDGYGRNHFLPFFAGTDLGLIMRSRPLLASSAHAGAVYVDDGWVSQMMTKEKLNNRRQPIAGSKISLKFIQNALLVLGQCFDLALEERPAVLEVNPARHIQLPKQDRREMHCLSDASVYLALHEAMDAHFRPLLDVLVGTGVRYGEAAGLLAKHVHLDAAVPYMEIKLALKWRGRKWKLGRPKTKSSLRAVSLPPRLVEVLRPLVDGKAPEEHVFTMVEGGPLHHGNFYKRYFQVARKNAAGIPSTFRIHDLRHTFAGWALSGNVAPHIVMRQLGHSSITTTVNVYGHVTPAADAKLLDLINELLPGGLAVSDNTTVVSLSPAEQSLPEFDIDDFDDLAA